MNAELSKKYVRLYNDAILKIFPTETIEQVFGNALPSVLELNKMTFPENVIANYPKCNETKILDEVCNPLFEQKRIFLEFIQENFPELTNQWSQNVGKLLDIEKKVKDFIKKMEVNTPRVMESEPLEIVVTLHDIIGNFSTTSFGSPHCLSEKLFLAILFAIKKKVNVFELKRGYNLKFKFAKSSFGKSGLQKSSVICSSDKSITESTDPVDASTNFFKLKLTKLDEAALAQQVKMNRQAAPEGAAEAAKAKAAAEATSTPGAEAAEAAEATAAAEATSTPGAGAAAEAPPDAAPTPVQPVAVLGNEAATYAAQEDNTAKQKKPLEIQPHPGPAEAPPATMRGDELFEKHKDSSINKEYKDDDFENYRRSVLEKFKSEESYYDTEFSELPKPTEYQLKIVKSVIARNENLFNNLLDLLSLTLSADLYKKLLFIHGIFLTCQFQNTSCSKIATIISGLSTSSNVPVFIGGGSKSRRRHRRHAHKTRRGRGRGSGRKSKSNAKSKTHRRRRHSRVRKHKKNTYTRRR